MGHAVGEKKLFVSVYACICVCVAVVVYGLLCNSGIWEWLKCKAIRDGKIYVFTVVCFSGAHIFLDILLKEYNFSQFGLYHDLCAVGCAWHMLV